MFKWIPQEVKFFEMFVRSAENLLRGAKLLKDISGDFGSLAQDAAKLERLEHDSDVIYVFGVWHSRKYDAHHHRRYYGRRFA